jgi:transposase-like protein
MLIKYSKLSLYKLKKIIHCFVVDLNATQTAKILWINRNTVNHYYNIFRLCIYKYQCKRFKEYIGRDCEYDESYWGAKRIRWYPWKSKRWRWTSKKIVFWIYEREWWVFTEVIPDASSNSIASVIRGHTDIETVIRTDKRRWYDWLVDVAYQKHFRVNHSKHFVNRLTHINWIEAYRSYSRRRLAKFNWITKNFLLHLKECEWRYLNNDHELCKLLLKLIKTFY